MLNTFEVNKVLIIAPLRVARDTWPAEIEKWDHLKNLDISIVVGDVKTQPGKRQVAGGVLREERNALGFWHGRDR